MPVSLGTGYNLFSKKTGKRSANYILKRLCLMAKGQGNPAVYI